MKFLLGFLCLVSLSVHAADSPNFLLILTDDHGWSQLSEPLVKGMDVASSQYLETPNIDRLGRSGIRFTNGYAPAPLCTPTRRAIQCGTSAARSGSEFRSKWVPHDHTTMPVALKKANPAYRCAHFGKWGEQMISTPEQCGYDASDGETGNVTGGMPNSLRPDKKGANHENSPPHFIDNEDPKRTVSVTDRAIAFMKEQSEAGAPFYVQTSFYAQHLSVVCSEKALAKYEKKGTPDRGYPQAWAAMLDELDQGIGRLLDAIEDLGIGDNTYVVFLADNGGRGTIPGGDETATPPNVPLTGAKHSIYEGGIRVPFLAKGPGIEPGGQCDEPVVGYDLLPTFYELAGGTEKLSGEVDGVSISPLFGDPSVRVERPQGALFFHRPDKGFSAIRSGDEKLMVFWNQKDEVISTELYDLSADVTEEGHDISASNPEKVETLKKRLLDYLATVDAEKRSEMPSKKKKQPKRKKKKE